MQTNSKIGILTGSMFFFNSTLMAASSFIDVNATLHVHICLDGAFNSSLDSNLGFSRLSKKPGLVNSK